MSRVARQSSSSFVFCVRVDLDYFCSNHLDAAPVFKSTSSIVPITSGHYAGSLNNANQLIGAQWWSTGTRSLGSFLNLVDSSTFIPLLIQNRSQGNVHIENTSRFPACVTLQAGDKVICTVQCTFYTAMLVAILTG
jgi:hypothetical protein